MMGWAACTRGCTALDSWRTCALLRWHGVRWLLYICSPNMCSRTASSPRSQALQGQVLQQLPVLQRAARLHRAERRPHQLWQGRPVHLGRAVRRAGGPVFGGGARARCGSWQPAGNLGPVRPSWVHAPRRRRLLQGARPLGCTGRCVDITDMRRRPAPGCRRAFSRMRSGPT